MERPPDQLGDRRRIVTPCDDTVAPIAESVDGKEKWEAIVGERDLISWPPGVYRGEINIGDEEALMLVMLGAAKPETPTYRPNDPLSKIKRPAKSAEAA